MVIDYSKFDEKSDAPISAEYKQGREAYLNLVNHSDNPYKILSESEKYWDWECGWCDAEGYADYVSGEGV